MPGPSGGPALVRATFLKPRNTKPRIRAGSASASLSASRTTSALCEQATLQGRCRLAGADPSLDAARRLTYLEGEWESWPSSCNRVQADLGGSALMSNTEGQSSATSRVGRFGWFVIALIVVSLGGAIGREMGWRWAMPGDIDTSNNVRRGVERAAARFNQELPLEIDAETRLDRVSIGPGLRMVYHHVLLGERQHAADQEAIRLAVSGQTR